jgi:hypothetical protein
MENPNPWQIIFDGYKKGIKPGKQVWRLHFLLDFNYVEGQIKVLA